jgi:hypothetical protein
MKAFLVKYYSFHFLILETRVLVPDSIRSVDPEPYSESGSGSRRAKNDPQKSKNTEISCFEVLDVLF